MTEELSGSTEFHIRRHPESKGTPVPAQGPEGEAGPPGPLPREGIQQAQEEARKLAEHVRDIPKAVVFGFRSNQPRTEEADYVFGQEMRVMAQKLPNSKIFDAKEKSLEVIASEVDDSTDKIVIINSPEHKAFGMRNYDMEYVVGQIKELGEPAFFGKWLSDPEVQKKAGVAPQQIVEETRSWIKEQQAKTSKLFPGRPVVITGIGHSSELDVAIAALLGKNFSEQTLNEVGGEIIKTMEGARIVIDESGKGTVEYRGMKEELDLSEGIGE